MIQKIVATTIPNWPNIEVNYHKPIDFFVDNFSNYDTNKDSVKILCIREVEAISKFREIAIKNHKLFDAIITYDDEVIKSCKNSYFLPFGTTWIKDYKFVEKKFQVSHLTGHKLWTEGHHLRHKVHYKQGRITIPKDFYVSSHGTVPHAFKNKVLEDKKEPLFESQFHICIEGSKQINCFTEKLIDCFVTKTVPIYWGCPNIGDFFNTKGMFIANNFDEIMNAVSSLNENSYYEKIEYIEDNFILSNKYTNIVRELGYVINKILKDINK